MNHSDKNVLTEILQSQPERFQHLLDNADYHEIQILYTQINRDETNYPHFTSYSYRTNKEHFFFPASTVKLPVVILALEKINNLNIEGLAKYTPLRIDSAYVNQTEVLHDSTSENNLPTIAHYIKKVFLVSDNDAYNRLYEFLGQKTINESLWAKGFEDVCIVKRLSTFNTPEEDRYTNPLTFYDGDKILYRQPLVYNPEQYPLELQGLQKGRGHYSDGELIEEPLDFTRSNYFSIESQQEILRSLLFPEAVPEKQRFNLSNDDYAFLCKYMSMLPRESDYPNYDSTEYYDSYVKYFMFGNSRDPIPEHIRIFNKVGQAYGYLVDNAYIVDFENEVEFLLTAVIYANANQILNDDTYEYDEISFPFLAQLGRTIYEYELKRERKFAPDLSKFRFDYP
ncbi:serine hydrolase [candidate division KSB1 bacterium]|nr:serine hydrolase [candidate division KSB1 bacterium]NIR70089.1 serine hydrolase [candidate division KSB1 bacterium]NIS27514.1 serine hydrolase [candidate division KSB1 bacterium]NIT74365.1 serine hydrolase [candidate division KSB1 bacterium]NIU28232.1 serine hydrolase [candidate division KSB1 bacterium]